MKHHNKNVLTCNFTWCWRLVDVLLVEIRVVYYNSCGGGGAQVVADAAHHRHGGTPFWAPFTSERLAASVPPRHVLVVKCDSDADIEGDCDQEWDEE